MPLSTRLDSTREQLIAVGVDVTTYMDGIEVTLLELPPEPVAIKSHPREKLGDLEGTLKIVKTVSMPPQAMPRPSVSVVAADEAVALGMPVGSDGFLERHALQAVSEVGSNALTVSLLM